MSHPWVDVGIYIHALDREREREKGKAGIKSDRGGEVTRRLSIATAAWEI